MARGFSGEIDHLTELIEAGIKHKRFALIDILQPCVSFNRVNTFKWYSERVYKIDKVPRPGIGIIVLDEEVAAGMGVIGVVIDRVVPISEADRVGLQGIDYRNRSLGDIIVAAGNQEVKNIDDFIRVLENYAIGQMIMLDVRRGDQIRNLEVKIMDIS